MRLRYATSFALTLTFVLTACAGSQTSSSATESTSAGQSSPAADMTSSTDASAAGHGACPFISNAQVNAVVTSPITGVDVNADGTKCDFNFKGATTITLEYAAQGGADRMHSEQETASAMNGTLGHGAPLATPPGNTPKIGDDQEWIVTRNVVGFVATKGDAYSEATVAFMADPTSAWSSLPELARRVLATH